VSLFPVFFVIFYLNNFTYEIPTTEMLSDYEFHENWYSEGYTLFQGHKFVPVLSTLGLCEIWMSILILWA
jgi:hypothetical protein